MTTEEKLRWVIAFAEESLNKGRMHNYGDKEREGDLLGVINKPESDFQHCLANAARSLQHELAKQLVSELLDEAEETDRLSRCAYCGDVPIGTRFVEGCREAFCADCVGDEVAS